MIALAALVLSAALQAAPVPGEPQRTLSVSTLASYLKAEDYPKESIRRGEQGRVQFAIAVGIDGRVKSCTIIQSSGFDRLDSKTCSIMQERLRFKPALDPQGRPVEDSYAGVLNWELSN